MNEFIKKNPEYAKDFYRQMKHKYTGTVKTEVKPGVDGQTFTIVLSEDYDGHKQLEKENAKT